MPRCHMAIALVLGSLVSFMAFGERLSGRIVDDAGLLSPVQRSELENFLAEHEAQSTNQIVVVTLKSLESKSIEEFANELGRKWGIGTKDKNNGVLLVVALQEREVRIEVGYGLESSLTDAQGKIIIERNILPLFRKGEMGEGIIQGVRSIASVLGHEEPIAPKLEEEPKLDWIYIIFIFLMFILFFIRAGRGSGRGPRPPRSGGLFGGGGRSGGSDSGGFSGGGGSFGGGGASGKWS